MLFKISLDSMRALESLGLDSINALDSESTLDSVDSLFLKLAFSRILSNFLESCVSQKKKGFPLSPLSPAQKKIKRRVFAALCLQPVGSFCANGERASLFLV